MKTFVVSLVALATATFAHPAAADGVDYKPRPGVTMGQGGGGASMPNGIPPECLAEKTQAEIRACIKDKELERARGRTLQGSGKK